MANPPNHLADGSVDGVNQQGVGVRREIVWLRKQDSELQPFG